MCLLTHSRAPQFQLKRFEYDYQLDRNCKVSSRFDFPPDLDMRPYLAPEERAAAEAGDPAAHTYDLHSILVHAGTPVSGHYYSFIRPLTRSPRPYAHGAWYKFNDSVVSGVEMRDAFEQSRGTDGWGSYGAPTAYLLIYVRRSHTFFKPAPAPAVREGGGGGGRGGGGGGGGGGEAKGEGHAEDGKQGADAGEGGEAVAGLAGVTGGFEDGDEGADALKVDIAIPASLESYYAR